MIWRSWQWASCTQNHGVLAQLDIALDERGNVATKDFATNQEGVFAAGDMRTGQSLVGVVSTKAASVLVQSTNT